jgi:hypothetical protein
VIEHFVTAVVEMSCLPESHDDCPAYTVRVAYRGNGLYAVEHMRWCYDANYQRDYNRVPDEGGEEWLARYRFNFTTALLVAQRVAHLLIVNGRTAEQLLKEGQS